MGILPHVRAKHTLQEASYGSKALQLTNHLCLNASPLLYYCNRFQGKDLFDHLSNDSIGR